MVPIYYRGCDAAVLVYDITEMRSFDQMKEWFFQVRGEVSDCVMCVCGGKLDLKEKRDVPAGLGKDFAEENDALWFEISAKSGENVEAAFKALAGKLSLQAPKNKEKEEEEGMGGVAS